MLIPNMQTFCPELFWFSRYDTLKIDIVDFFGVFLYLFLFGAGGWPCLNCRTSTPIALQVMGD